MPTLGQVSGMMRYAVETFRAVLYRTASSYYYYYYLTGRVSYNSR